MLLFIQRKPLYLNVLPIIAIIIFSCVFDLTTFRFDFAEILKNVKLDSLSMSSSFILVQLGSAISICVGLIALYASYFYFNEYHNRFAQTQLLKVLIVAAIVASIIYNTMGAEFGVSNFLYFAKMIVDDHLKLAFLASFDISVFKFDILFYLPFFLSTSGAIAICGTATLFTCAKEQSADGAKIFRALRAKKRVILLSFYLATIVVSTIIVMIFVWHNFVRTAISDPNGKAEFTKFMFSFSLYWGMAYSSVVICAFAPVMLIFNAELSETLADHTNEESEQSILENFSLNWINVNDVRMSGIAFSPLLTALATNVISSVAVSGA